MLQTFWETEYFTVFNILTITPSFLNEIQNVSFIKMISGKSSAKADKMKTFLNTLCVFVAACS
jgi:hypothetical protein